MSRHWLIVALLLGSLAAPPVAYAQLVPPAGTAGAGNTPINGVPFGPANPSVLSDPSGTRNASKIPPLRTNSLQPSPTPRPPLQSTSPSRITPPYAGASQRAFIPDPARRKGPPVRHRRQPEVSKFTGICRGC
jgi:hypothetical protein